MQDMVAEPTPAEVYDTRFVPALFGPWAPRMAAWAGAGPGARALDVGCGTGALALAMAGAVGPAGEVTGLDPNPEMLAVARAKPGAVTWVEGRAEALPFAAERFDAVGSQFAFMFVADRAAALAEMARVLRPGGRAAVAVCGALDRSPGYAALAALLDRLFGREVGEAFRAPFVLGDAAALAAIAAEAGLADAEVREETGEVRFASIADLVSTERACVWTLGGLLDAGQFARLSAEAETALARFAGADGRVRFAMPALVLSFGRG